VFMKTRRFVALALLAAVSASFLLPAPNLSADTAATAPAATRSPEAIIGDVRKTMTALQPMISHPSSLSDTATRDEIRDKALPVLQNLSALADEMLTVDDSREAQLQIKSMKGSFQMIQHVLGDKAATDALKSAAESKDEGEALGAKSNLLYADW